MENLTDALRWFSPKAHTDSTRFNKKEDSTKVGMREFDFVIVLIRGNLWKFVAEKIFTKKYLCDS